MKKKASSPTTFELVRKNNESVFGNDGEYNLKKFNREKEEVARSIFSVLSAQHITPVLEYTMAGVRSAIAAHERGIFNDSGPLIDRIMRDSRISTTLDMRINALLGKNKEYFAEDTEKGKQYAEAIEKIWERVAPESAVHEMMSSWLMAGFGLAELRWTFEPATRMLVPTLKPWHPSNVMLNVVDMTWHVLTRDNGYQKICPGDGKWVLITRGPRGYMNGFVRNLGTLWFMHEFALLSWTRFNEKHGIPITKVKVPSNAADPDKASFYSGMQSLASEGVLELPQNVGGTGGNFDVEFAEVTATGWQTQENLISAINQEISILILKQNLTTQVDGGAYAAAQVHEKVLADVIRADSEFLAREMREQVVKHIIEKNFIDADTDSLPTPFYDASEAVDEEKKLANIAAFIDINDKITSAGYEIKNFSETLSEMGLVVEKRQQPTSDTQSDSHVQSPDSSSGTSQSVSGSVGGL